VIPFGGSQLNIPSCVLESFACSIPDLVHADQKILARKAQKNWGGT
jgi:hypothetical protein